MSSNLSRGLQSSIDNTPLEDGKLRFAIDTARLFLDTVKERIEFTDIIKGLKYNEIIALQEPKQKIYLASDTLSILSYDFKKESWVLYGEGPDPSDYISEIKYDSSGKLIITFGNGESVSISNNYIDTTIENLSNELNSANEEIDILKEKVKVLQDTLDKYVEAIELITKNV